MKLCGHDYPDEPNPDNPGFWPVARAWAAAGGHASQSKGVMPHHGNVAESVQLTLRQHALEDVVPYIYRHDVSAKRAYSTLVGLNRHSCKRCRKELACAFLALFDPDSCFHLLRTDRPHGAGLLVTDRQNVGILFVEFHQ